MNFSQKDIDRFWKKVDKKGEDECWNWLGSLNKAGYGNFKLNGTVKGAHCCSLFLAHTVQPLNKTWTLHTCKENTKCCNPNHLYYGTPKENSIDRIKDQTQPRMKGETNGQSKLTEIQVREIRQKYIPWKYTIKKLSKEYGVAESRICDIINNKTWK